MKRRLILVLAALVLIAGFILPGVANRMAWEEESQVYVVAVDVTRLAKYFSEEELPEILAGYRESGVTTAVVAESRGVYDERLIQMSQEAGLSLTLAPDISFSGDAGLGELVEAYDVRYIKLQSAITKSRIESVSKSRYVCQVLEEKDLTLVLSETIYQLGNVEPVNYEDYIEAADGNLIRTYDSLTITNVSNKEYNAIYYHLYNSAYDRNTRFITIKQLADNGFTHAENAARTQESIRLFCEKMEEHGFVHEGRQDYNSYTVNRVPISAAAVAASILLAALMLDLLWPRKIPYLLPAALVLAGGGFGVTFLLPESIVLLYPTLFAIFAPCFCVAMTACYIHWAKERLGFWPLLLSTAAAACGLFALSGAILTALLSGPDYFLNNLTFRGVKLSLMAPIGFTFLLFAAWIYDRETLVSWWNFLKQKRTAAQYKELLRKAWAMVRWYHIAMGAAALLVVVVYLVRSGNVNQISFAEVWFRNTLTELFVARPRTKEFILGWPCLALYVYYVKTDRSKLLQFVFAMGASILFASNINTFCHVFTMAKTMFLRIFTGLAVGSVVSLLALAANQVILKAIESVDKRLGREF